MAKVITTEQGLGRGRMGRQRTLYLLSGFELFLEDNPRFDLDTWVDFSMFPCSPLTSQYYRIESKDYLSTSLKETESLV